MGRSVGKPYVEERVMQYTEVVYFDGDGIEVGREDKGDVSWFDTRETRDMTASELDDYGLAEEVDTPSE